MRGLVQLQNTLAMIRENLNPDVEIEGILPTLVDNRTVHAKEAIEILEENFGDRVFASRITKTVRFAEAPVKGMSVLKYEPDGKAASAYRAAGEGGPLTWQAVSGRACARGRWRRSSADGGARTSGRARRPRTRSAPTCAAEPVEREPPTAARARAAPEPEPPEPERAGRLSRYEGASHARGAAAHGLLLGHPREHPGAGPRARRRARAGARARGRAGADAHAQSPLTRKPVLRVVGVGGAGVNAVDRMIEAAGRGRRVHRGQHRHAVARAVERAHARAHRRRRHARPRLGRRTPTLGRQSAIEQYDELKGLLKGADMIFITAGAGGGTGTGAAPVVARISREVGALTVGIVTKPFAFEGAKRGAQAEVGIDELAAEVDTLITIPNSRLLSVLDKQTSMVDAFRVADDVLRQGVQGISDLIALPGLINLDFADVRTIMSRGRQRAARASAWAPARTARSTPRRTRSSRRCWRPRWRAPSRSCSRSPAGSDLSLWEVNECAKAVAEAAHPDANIIFGAMVDEKLADEVWITVVATGYGDRGAPDASANSGPPARGRREPRVTRARREPVSGGLGDLDVPEFLPRG